jgi:hypothetical protein
MKDKEFLNFMGDDGNYIFNPPMPNPYGLRGNPDNNANCQNNDCFEGDGLNGTPAYFDANDRVYDYPPAYSGFDGSQWTNDGTEQTGWNNQTGDGTEQTGNRSWFSRLFDSDGMTTYYTCTGGIVTSQRFVTGQQPLGWGRNRNNACLSQAQIDTKRQNTSNTIGNILSGFNQGLQTGLNVNNPNSPNYAPQFDPNYTPPQTTTVTESGIGSTGKIIGWVLVAGVVASLGYLALNKK